MKKKVLSLFTIGVVISGTLIAQQSSTKVNPGGIYLRGGYNAANISVTKDGGTNDAKTLSTFHIGATADIPLAPILSFQTGLLLNGKGSKSTYYADGSNHSDNYVKSTFNPLYLELPANLVLKFPVGTGARLYVGAGPYAAAGIGGKSKVESSFAGVKTSSSENIQFNDDNPLTGGQEEARYDRLKRFDFGINALAGVEINRFMVGVNYGLGLTKINSTQTNNTTDNNKYRTLSVGVGVKL